MAKTDTIIQNIQQEMRRGTLVLAVLTLMDQPQYGYSLIQALSNQGMEVEQNTLYPLMRRIESQGLLESIWQIEGNRPRRYYKISELGIQVRSELIMDWNTIGASMSKLIGGVST